jgi:anti-anti-sigma factor
MSDKSPPEQDGFVTGEVQDGALVLSVTSREIRDAQVSYALRDQMIGLIDEHGSQQVVIDFEPVEFIGSVGLLALLGVRRRLNEAGGRVVICNIAGLIREMLSACRLISSDASRPAVFETAATRDEALAMLRG